MIRFVHTSDWQLGRAFGEIPGDLGALLREQRLEAITRIAEVARAADAAFVLVAGDVFDAHTVADTVVTDACARIAAAELPFLLIPGNHDYGTGPECVYRRASFRHAKPPNLQLLETTDPVAVADGAAVLLPCPLRHRRTTGDPTAHLARELGAELAPGAIRIALAHGSVEGFGADDAVATNLIDLGCVARADLDYLALGDWHGLKQVAPRAWYAGTPEPDRFRDNRPGHVLVVSIESHGAEPTLEPRKTAHYRWQRERATMREPADVDRLAARLEALDPLRTLLRLEIDGTLSLDPSARLEALLAEAQGRLRALRRRGPGVTVEPTEAELDALGGPGAIGRAVDHLRRGSDETDRRALALLHELVRRADAEGLAP